MTVYAGPFLSEYNGNSSFGGKYGTHYLVKNKPDTVKVMWFYGTDGSWYYDNTNVPVEFHITCDTTSEPGKPTAPSKEDLATKEWVRVSCNTKPTEHTTVTYSLGTGDYEISEPVELDTQYTCTVTVHAAKYVAAYSNEERGSHTLDSADPAYITLTWTGTEWTNNGATADFTVKCTPTEVEPSAPTDNDLGVLDGVRVYCTTSTAHEEKTYKIKPDAIVSKSEKVVNGEYTIWLNVQPYVDAYNNDYPNTGHTSAEITDTVQLVLKYDEASSKWQVKGGDLATIEVKCDTTTKPSKPSMSQFANDVLVHCENSSNAHADTNYRDIYLGTTDSTRYTEVKVNGENVWQDTDGKWTYRIKLNKDKYIEAFNTNPNINTTHTDTNPGEETYVTWKYDSRQWNLVPVNSHLPKVGAVINVTCKPKAPTADDLKKLDMAVLVKCVVDGTQEHAHFYGLLGEPDYDYYVGEPEEINGDWLCTIEFVETRYVEAFTAELLGHVRNDEKVIPVTLIWDGSKWDYMTQGRVEMTEEYTVTFDPNNGTAETTQNVIYGGKATEPATEPKKSGYTFKGWYLGEDLYDFDTEVKSSITLKAKWRPATVYLFVQPVDSQGVKLVDRDTSIKDKSQQNVGRALNADTLARAGFTASKFGGYNHSNKEWITVGKMTTTQDLPTFQKMTDITGT